MKTRKMDFIITILGIILLGTGLFFIKTLIQPQGIQLTFPYILIGIGCGTFGHGMGNLITRKALKNNPNAQKQIEIATKDERNIAIANRAKAKAYDIMTFVFGALMLSFALMEINLSSTLLFVFAYLFVHGCGIYYRCKYEKEM